MLTTLTLLAIIVLAILIIIFIILFNAPGESPELAKANVDLFLAKLDSRFVLDYGVETLGRIAELLAGVAVNDISIDISLLDSTDAMIKYIDQEVWEGYASPEEAEKSFSEFYLLNEAIATYNAFSSNVRAASEDKDCDDETWEKVKEQRDAAYEAMMIATHGDNWRDQLADEASAAWEAEQYCAIDTEENEYELDELESF